MAIVHKKNSIVKIYSNAAIASYPVSSAGAGTITVQNTSVTILGTGTAFASTDIGGWLWDKTNNEIRKIVAVKSTTELVLRDMFSNNSGPGVGYNIIPKSSIKELGWVNAGAATATIDGETIPVGAYTSWDKGSLLQRGPDDFIDPILITTNGGAGTIVMVTATY